MGRAQRSLCQGSAARLRWGQLGWTLPVLALVAEWGKGRKQPCLLRLRLGTHLGVKERNL